jgi:hypothetical protein
VDDVIAIAGVTADDGVPSQLLNKKFYGVGKKFFSANNFILHSGLLLSKGKSSFRLYSE